MTSPDKQAVPEDNQGASADAHWAVFSQSRAEWPGKSYPFTDERQARMFLDYCKRSGDFRFELRRAA